MRQGIRRALALAGALVLTLSMSASVFAADKKEDIVLDGGEEGISKMIATFEPPSLKGKELDDYKYLGFASFLDLADKDYKYLQITYTGNITQFRIQAVHNAGQPDEEIDPVKYWFNAEVVADASNKALKTADGSAIPLEGNNTTVVIDLEASGIDMSYYNAGVHMHCDLMKTNGAFTISDARLVVPENAGKSNAGKTDSGDNKGNGNNTTDANGNTTTKPGDAPATGSATYPIVLGFGGIAVACALLVASRRFKEEY